LTTIEEYGLQLEERRRQLEQARQQVQEYDVTPDYSQQQLRAQTKQRQSRPINALQERAKRIAEVESRTGTKEEALGQIESSFGEQERLEIEYQKAVEDYQKQLAEQEAASSTYETDYKLAQKAVNKGNYGFLTKEQAKIAELIKSGQESKLKLSSALKTEGLTFADLKKKNTFEGLSQESLKRLEKAGVVTLTEVPTTQIQSLSLISVPEVSSQVLMSVEPKRGFLDKVGSVVKVAVTPTTKVIEKAFTRKGTVPTGESSISKAPSFVERQALGALNLARGAYAKVFEPKTYQPNKSFTAYPKLTPLNIVADISQTAIIKIPEAASSAIRGLLQKGSKSLGLKEEGYFFGKTTPIPTYQKVTKYDNVYNVAPEEYNRPQNIRVLTREGIGKFAGVDLISIAPYALIPSRALLLGGAAIVAAPSTKDRTFENKIKGGVLAIAGAVPEFLALSKPIITRTRLAGKQFSFIKETAFTSPEKTTQTYVMGSSRPAVEYKVTTPLRRLLGRPDVWTDINPYAKRTVGFVRGLFTEPSPKLGRNYPAVNIIRVGLGKGGYLPIKPSPSFFLEGEKPYISQAFKLKDVPKGVKNVAEVLDLVERGNKGVASAGYVRGKTLSVQQLGEGAKEILSVVSSTNIRKGTTDYFLTKTIMRLKPVTFENAPISEFVTAFKDVSPKALLKVLDKGKYEVVLGTVNKGIQKVGGELTEFKVKELPEYIKQRVDFVGLDYANRLKANLPSPTGKQNVFSWLQSQEVALKGEVLPKVLPKPSFTGVLKTPTLTSSNDLIGIPRMVGGAGLTAEQLSARQGASESPSFARGTNPTGVIRVREEQTESFILPSKLEVTPIVDYFAPAQKVDIIQKPDVGFKQSPALKEELRAELNLGQLPALREELKPKQDIVQRPRQRIIFPTPFPKARPPLKPPIKIKLPILSSQSQMKQIAGGILDEFKVYVRKSGEDVSIGKFRNLGSARKALRTELVGSLRASGFIERGGRPLRFEDVGLGGEFVPSKKDYFRVVQTKTRRLSARPETREIQLFRKKKGGFDFL